MVRNIINILWRFPLHKWWFNKVIYYLLFTINLLTFAFLRDSGPWILKVYVSCKHVFRYTMLNI